MQLVVPGYSAHTSCLRMLVPILRSSTACSERLAAAEIPQGSTSKNPYTPPLSVAQKFIESRHDLVELSVRSNSPLELLSTVSLTLHSYRPFVIGFMRSQLHSTLQRSGVVICPIRRTNSSTPVGLEGSIRHEVSSVNLIQMLRSERV